MKSILLIAALAFATSSFASDLKKEIAQIEFENNARCELVKKSVGICLGYTVEAKLCFYNYKYTCFSQDSKFTVKVKAKSYFDQQRMVTVEKIRKVKIKK